MSFCLSASLRIPVETGLLGNRPSLTPTMKTAFGDAVRILSALPMVISSRPCGILPRVLVETTRSKSAAKRAGVNRTSFNDRAKVSNIEHRSSHSLSCSRASTGSSDSSSPTASVLRFSPAPIFIRNSKTARAASSPSVFSRLSFRSFRGRTAFALNALIRFSESSAFLSRALP